jgi:hypothetical protein
VSRPVQPSSSGCSRRGRALLRAALACVLGVGAALLVSCGSSSKGLIPTANAGPLQNDFEAVAQAAQSGNGNCTATEVALVKTLHDFYQLPASVDAGLRNTLRQGIENLRTRALALCAQPLTPTTTTGTTAKTTTTAPTTPTTTTSTQTTPTQPTTTPTTPTTTTPAGTGGGTAAPGESPSGGGTGAGEGGGVGAGGGVGPEGGK